MDHMASISSSQAVLGALNKLVQEVLDTSGATAPGSSDHTLGNGYYITSMNVRLYRQSGGVNLTVALMQKTKP